MEALQTTQYTYEEYLEIEKTSELRHEFFYGELFAMAGTTIIHNDIAVNLTVSLSSVLKGKNCKVNVESVKVRIKEKGHYAYPDVMVSCGGKDNDRLTIKHPILIVEVLSDSTRQYDIGKKFGYYKQIPSLKHYVLVEQEECLVTVYTKQNDFWIHKLYTNLEDIILLEHLNIEILVTDIYENIEVEQ